MRELQSRTTTPMKNNGSAIIYSASKGEQAADGLVGGNSPFTTAFIRALGSGEDELSDTFRRIQTEMETVGPIVAPGHKQTPFFESSLRSQYFLGRPDKDPQGTISRILIFDCAATIRSSSPLPCRDETIVSAKDFSPTLTSGLGQRVAARRMVGAEQKTSAGPVFSPL